MPLSLDMDEATATPRYAKFVTEPWESGFGHTIGNALRRVLLTMMDGVAVTRIRIDGVYHEFTPIPGVAEDVMDIILNIKKLAFRSSGTLPCTLEMSVQKAGVVTGADIKEDHGVQVLNKDLKLFTLTSDLRKPLRIELDLDKGRGYRPSENNKHEDQPANSIPVDSLFSPIERVRYDVGASRVEDRTDYDRLELEIWTDGRMEPMEALVNAATMLRKHLAIFESPRADQPWSEEEQQLINKLKEPIETLELSVRSANCLKQIKINFVYELVKITEGQLLKVRNFGRKSSSEIKEKLEAKGLSLDMTLNDKINDELQRIMADQLEKLSKEEQK
ncbi:MAG: DNA-directed RNA polymerase subunit alpha [Victivallales bacterium]|nr:DNA-directed RNA polymerase subunit alpha [Victivallales bacterium]